MTKITINGTEYPMVCNMRALIAFQRVTGADPMHLNELTPEQNITADYVLCWAMIDSAPGVKDAPQLDDILRDIDTIEKAAAMKKAVYEELVRFYHLEPGDEQPSAAKSDDDPKNE